jgi:hypothetical protein
MNINLYGLTCIKKFKVSLQVAIELGLLKFKRRFEFKSKLKPRYTVEIVEIL